MKFLPMWNAGLPSELTKKAEAELGETLEKKEQALLELRTLINNEKDLICLEDDTFLTKFLRAKKFDPKRSLKMLQNYYSFKKKISGMMTDFVRPILNSNVFHISPVRSPEGSFVFVIYVGQLNFENYCMDNLFHTAVILFEQAMEEEASQISGVQVVLDFKGISFLKMRYFSTPSFLGMLVNGIENCWPFRLAGCHVTNEPFYINIPYNIAYPMLSKKIRSRLHFYGSNVSKMYKRLPQECLPKQLGGVFGQDACETLTETIISRQIETESSNKYSYHREHKRRLMQQKKFVKTPSSCSLEADTSYIPSTTTIPGVAL